MAAVRAHGLRVPQDVAVTGYDDISWASHAEPPLTTVRQPIEPAADALVAALMQQAAGEPTASIVLPVELVVRRSSQA
jgi:DNA-binding LacI/PurR family transcriptional regulator